MDDETLARLRELPIERVAADLDIKVKGHKCLCPFHADRHPSGSFRHNRFRCFSCGARADVIGFTEQVLGVGFQQAVRYLMEERGNGVVQSAPVEKEKPECKPDVEYLASLVRHPVLNAEAQDFLFRQRHYNPAVVRWLGISSISEPMPCWRWGRKPFYDAPSLLIPYKSVDGTMVLNVQSRYLGTDPSKPRFRFPRGSSVRLYNLPVLQRLQSGDELWLAEGITDTIAHLSAGHKCIGVGSATTLRAEDLLTLRPYADALHITLHLAPDNDAAGRQLARQLAACCDGLGLPLQLHPLPEGVKDYSEWYGKKPPPTDTYSGTLNSSRLPPKGERMV